ncbi:MAG: alpha/beta hydrolase [Pseudomonadota bacterium]|uniref:alpha/beta hydrolase n=1 Tax=Alteromonas australica TaxID=589873 RepID=UPI002355DA66|nr:MULTISPECIES: alpha/beta hydrolase [Alteromonas]MED5334419.1 alpha/beta hydrolase [Pseudomonadota bacterium]
MRFTFGLATLLGIALMLVGCGTTKSDKREIESEKAETPYANLDDIKPQSIVYKTVNGKDLALDLYMPTPLGTAPTLAVWVHGGAWMRGSKNETLSKNGNLVASLLNEGVAVAAVNYRLSGEAIYPAAPNDINDAINFLVDNSDNLKLSAEHVIMMGRSAGGHLASLLTTSNNDDVPFLNAKPRYRVIGMVDFFGPSDFLALRGNSGKVDHDAPDAAEAQFLGESPLVNEALAREASPTTYIDNKTPPFIIFHGLDDGVVPATQSELLSRRLDQFGVPNELFLAKGKRHGDPVFDTDEFVSKVVNFVREVKKENN